MQLLNRPAHAAQLSSRVVPGGRAARLTGRVHAQPGSRGARVAPKALPEALLFDCDGGQQQLPVEQGEQINEEPRGG
jgi:hypothetical protein